MQDRAPSILSQIKSLRLKTQHLKKLASLRYPTKKSEYLKNKFQNKKWAEH